MYVCRIPKIPSISCHISKVDRTAHRSFSRNSAHILKFKVNKDKKIINSDIILHTNLNINDASWFQFLATISHLLRYHYTKTLLLEHFELTSMDLHFKLWTKPVIWLVGPYLQFLTEFWLILLFRLPCKDSSNKLPTYQVKTHMSRLGQNKSF